METPWEQQKGENDLWFSRFDKYARPQGREYTLRTAYMLWKLDQPQSLDLAAYELWKTAESQYKWDERAKEWDIAHTSLLKHKWDKRRLELMEADYTDGNALRKLANKFLEVLPTLTEVSSSEVDGVTTVIQKINLRPGELAQLMKAGSELQRLSVNEPTIINKEVGDGKKVQLYLPETTTAEAFNGPLGMSQPTEPPQVPTPEDILPKIAEMPPVEAEPD